MRAFAKGLLGALALVGLLLVGLTFAVKSHAQVTDKPITTWPTEWWGVVWNLSMNDKRGCVAGWAPAPDKWSEKVLQIAFVDGVRLTSTGQQRVSDGITDKSLATLAGERTQNVFTIVTPPGPDGFARIDPVAQPCYDKLQAPPPPWIVSPNSTGKRPAYLLNADGTRGKIQGTADTTYAAATGVAPMWCRCKTRSVETTSSTYCTWPDAQKATTDPMRVTLCQQSK